MNNELSLAMPALPEQSRSKMLIMWVAAILVCCIVAGVAVASTETTAVDDVWDKVSSWAAGAPGKIIALMSFLAAVWYGIVRPNYTNAVGAILFCLLMANAKSIIETFLDMAVF